LAVVEGVKRQAVEHAVRDDGYFLALQTALQRLQKQVVKAAERLLRRRRQLRRVALGLAAGTKLIPLETQPVGEADNLAPVGQAAEDAEVAPVEDEGEDLLLHRQVLNDLRPVGKKYLQIRDTGENVGRRSFRGDRPAARRSAQGDPALRL